MGSYFKNKGRVGRLDLFLGRVTHDSELLILKYCVLSPCSPGAPRCQHYAHSTLPHRYLRVHESAQLPGHLLFGHGQRRSRDFHEAEIQGSRQQRRQVHAGHFRGAAARD